MTLQAEEIVVGGTGRIYVAPEGTELPQYLSEALHADFVDLGYTTEDGVKFIDRKTTNKIRPWQSFYPVRVHVTEREALLELTLLQWNSDNVILAFGGGGFTQPQPGEYRYHPPAPETVDVRAVVLDVTDGDRNYRWSTARAFVTSSTETQFAKSGPSLLPLTFEVLAFDDGDPWNYDSDDAALAPSAS